MAADSTQPARLQHDAVDAATLAEVEAALAVVSSCFKRLFEEAMATTNQELKRAMLEFAESFDLLAAADTRMYQSQKES